MSEGCRQDEHAAKGSRLVHPVNKIQPKKETIEIKIPTYNV